MSGINICWPLQLKFSQREAVTTRGQKKQSVFVLFIFVFFFSGMKFSQRGAVTARRIKQTKLFKCLKFLVIVSVFSKLIWKKKFQEEREKYKVLYFLVVTPEQTNKKFILPSEFLEAKGPFDMFKQFLSLIELYSTFLLAPTGALIVMMVYYTYIIRTTF